MNFIKPEPLFIFSLFILSLIFPSGVSPETTQKGVAGADEKRMVINSDALDIDNQRKTVIFSGNVKVKRDNLTIDCKKIHLYYNEAQSGKGTGKLNIKVDRIVATGKVIITRADGGYAKSENAVYYQDEEKVILTGNPVVRQGNDFVEGEKITLFLKEKRSIVEGSKGKKVRAVLSQKNKKR